MMLDKIIETKKEEVDRLKKEASAVRLMETGTGRRPGRDFLEALSGRATAIIAEVKCASASRGRLVEKFDPLALAKTYEENGAAAISVLTDETYFQGCKDYLTQIKDIVGVPVLRKDFIIDPLQLYETKAIGADAVLLIVRVLGLRLSEFLALAARQGLTALVEVHTRGELDLALAAGAAVIGINNRNLDTFATDINTSVDLKKHVPPGRVVVAESAIKERSDIEHLKKAGIGAFLIGEGLVTAPDPGAKLRSFLGATIDAG